MYNSIHYDKYIYSCNHYNNQSIEYFYYPRKVLYAPPQSFMFPILISRQSLIYFCHCSIVLKILEFHVNEITQLLMSGPFFSSICYCMCEEFFLFIDEWYTIVWMYDNLHIHSSVNEYLICFQLGTFTNRGAMNTHV